MKNYNYYKKNCKKIKDFQAYDSWLNLREVEQQKCYKEKINGSCTRNLIFYEQVKVIALKQIYDFWPSILVLCHLTSK